jgi:spore coat protein U-like protein
MITALRIAIVAGFVFAFGAAGASAQTCSRLEFLSGFGPTSVDIVPGTATPTATATFRSDCVTGSAGHVRHCLFIDPTADTARDSASFYVTAAPDSRLAWDMTGGAGGSPGFTIKRFGVGQATQGQTCAGGGANAACSLATSYTLRYLTRQQQDRVRPGTYTSTYQVVAFYGAGGTSTGDWCNSGNFRTDSSPNIRTNFTVTANVLTNCQLENFANIDFGSRGGVTAASSSAGGIRAFGNIGVRCTYETPYSISIGEGMNASNGVRRMANGTDYVAYELLQPGCTTPWTTASGVAGTGNTVNAITNHQVCGQLVTPVAQAAPTGDYSDTVVVTVTF